MGAPEDSIGIVRLCLVNFFLLLKICYGRDFSFEINYQNSIDHLITKWS